jgi:hypothetical protein
MNQKMAYCGILCDECLAYKATATNNDELRKKTAAKWSKMSNSDIKPAQINCLGCRSETHFNFCDVCEVRACNQEKKLSNCGECASFPCSKEQAILEQVPGAKERLKASGK